MSKSSAMTKNKVAARIKEARLNAGLTQGQLAKLLRLHREAVTAIEGGNRGVSAEELSLIAEVTDVSVSWLLGESAESLEVDDPRIELAARELKRLEPKDLERLLKLLAAIKDDRKKNRV